MDEIFRTLFQGERSAYTVLLFVFFLVITGRLVPWWQINEMKEKLAKYEEKAPDLIETMEKLIKIQEEENEHIKEESILKPAPHVVKPRKKSPHKGEDE